MKTALTLGLLVLSLVLVGCTGGTTSESKGSAGNEYDIKAKVVEVAADKQTVTLDHEAIPELNMMAMKMKYRVESPKVLEGVSSGDQVQGKLKKTADGYVVTKLEKR
jgi:Cu/Ag efflux protein CusF